MRTYILADANWKTIEKAEFELAILPWGATEAHNYHLPYGTDNIEVEKIANESSRIAYDKGAKLIVLPTIHYGVNTGQTDIKLCMNLNPSTQFMILNDIIETLNRHGISKLLILNGHGGNEFKPILRELGLKFPKMLLCSCNWFQALPKNDYFEHNGDHADELETSLLLHLQPNLVLDLSEAGDGIEMKNTIEAFNEGWAWTERKWSKVTADTGIGNPKQATKEKGERYFNDLIHKLAQLYIDLAKQNTQYS